MMFSRFALASKPAARTGAVFALLALAGLGIGAANTEAVVALRFAAALKASPQDVVALSGDRALVAGSEAYWLAEKRRHEADGAIEPAAWSAPLAAGVSVGDRITISSGKSERVLQVVAIAGVEPTPGVNPVVRQIAVTCRDLSTPDGALTTFIAPADGSFATARTARAL